MWNNSKQRGATGIVARMGIVTWIGLVGQVALVGWVAERGVLRALATVVVLGLVQVGIARLGSTRLRQELTCAFAVAGLGGLGMVIGGRIDAAVPGMLAGCLVTCIWLCRHRELCPRDRDWRHHLAGMSMMLVGMAAGGALLDGRVLASIAGGAAGHWSMVIGMAIGTTAGFLAVDVFDDQLVLRSPNQTIRRG